MIVAVLAAAVIASVIIGTRSVPPAQTWDAFTSGVGQIWSSIVHLRAPTVSKPDDIAGIVWDLRIPRTVLGLMCGLAIGAAGALSLIHI